MANPFDYNRLSHYITGLVDRRTKAITQGITDSIGFLQTYLDRAKAQADVSATQAGISKSLADAAAASALSADTIRHILYKLYVGVNDTDPIRTALGDIISDQAFGIRASDGRLRYARVLDQGVINWQDATVKADRQSVIDIAKGLLLFLDSADTQIVKGPVGFIKSPTGPQVDDFTSASMPNAKSVEDYVSKRLRSLIPTGTILSFFGTAAPTGWALCDGGTYRLADGSGSIGAPDLRGRVVVGVSAAHAFGEAFGATTNTADTTMNTTGASVTTATRTVDAGGSASGMINRVSFTDPGHKHAVTVDVTQPSYALIYIMKL